MWISEVKVTEHVFFVKPQESFSSKYEACHRDPSALVWASGLISYHEYGFARIGSKWIVPSQSVSPSRLAEA